MRFEIRENRTPQGRKKLHKERAAYFDLVQQGYSSKEACRIVGGNRRTGKRWRNGSQPTAGKQGASPARPAQRPDACSRYLSQAERIWIADRYWEKTGIRTIARELGRSSSTISREIRRNRHPVNGQYRPYAAQDRAPSAVRMFLNSRALVGNVAAAYRHHVRSLRTSEERPGRQDHIWLLCPSPRIRRYPAGAARSRPGHHVR